MTEQQKETGMLVLETSGRLIMEYGGETYRVEDTVQRMGVSLGFDRAECFAVPSGVFISCEEGSGPADTRVVRIRRKETDLGRVNDVNRVSRELSAGELSPQQALEELRRIEKRKETTSPGLKIVAAGVSSMGFSLIFGADWREALLALVTASLVQAVQLLGGRLRLAGHLSDSLIGSFLTVFLPLAVGEFVPGLNTTAAIAGGLMPLLPGLTMTNAIQDMLQGDDISGASHAMRALTVAALVAGGAMIAANIIAWRGSVG